MRTFSIIICVTIVSWIGWWIGSYIGMMTAYSLSFIGSLAGVYIGWRFWRDYLE